MELLEALHRDGYVVVKNAVSKQDCETIQTEFFDYLEKLVPGFHRNDRSTWTSKILPNRAHGLIQQYRVGTQAHAVHSRTAVKPVFDALYGNQELTCSFDGTCFAPCPSRFHFNNLEDWKEKTYKFESIHIDQTSEGFKSVQGGLAVVDQSENGKVFMCMPGSHKYHKEIMTMHQKDCEAERKRLEEIVDQAQKKQKTETAKLKKMPKSFPLWKEDNWLIMTDEMKAFLKKRGLERIRVPLKQGDVVLWDSRTVHYSSDFTRACNRLEYRLQVFVSFAPRLRGEAYEAEIKKRQQGWKEGRTSHCQAQQLKFFSMAPRTRSQEDKDKVNSMNPVESFNELTLEEKKFHGLVKY